MSIAEYPCTARMQRTDLKMPSGRCGHRPLRTHELTCSSFVLGRFVRIKMRMRQVATQHASDVSPDTPCARILACRHADQSTPGGDAADGSENIIGTMWASTLRKQAFSLRKACFSTKVRKCSSPFSRGKSFLLFACRTRIRACLGNGFHRFSERMYPFPTTEKDRHRT